MRIRGTVTVVLAILSCLLLMAGGAYAAPKGEGPTKRLLYDDLPPAPSEGEFHTQFSTLCPWNSAGAYYRFENGTADITSNLENQAVRDGMAFWSKVSPFEFIEWSFTDFIKVRWAVGSHGDGVPFDNGGSAFGNVLAHAFYPCPENGSWGGDVHFDDFESWTVGIRSSAAQPIDLVTIAAHEIGHAIGIQHSGDPDSLMYQTETAGGYTGSHRYLAWDDILAVQSLYGRQNGTYHLRSSNTSGAPNSSFLFQNLGDKPLAGDWNGDGIDTTGVYRPSNQTFYLRNSNSTGGANYTFAFGSGVNGAGSAGDRPVVGDWNGDGIDTIGVYRPSNGAYYLRNTNSAGAPFAVFGFGNTEDLPIAGDWNEDGVDTIGVYRPSNGTFYMKNANNGTPPVDYVIPFGNSGTDDQPVVGDWNTSGTDTVGIYRLSNATFYLSDTNAQGPPDYMFTYGINAFGQMVANRLPVSGDWDGDGSPTIGLYQN